MFDIKSFYEAKDVKDAVEALVALGYGSTESLKAVRSVNPDEHLG